MKKYLKVLGILKKVTTFGIAFAVLGLISYHSFSDVTVNFRGFPISISFIFVMSGLAVAGVGAMLLLAFTISFLFSRFRKKSSPVESSDETSIEAVEAPQPSPTSNQSIAKAISSETPVVAYHNATSKPESFSNILTTRSS